MDIVIVGGGYAGLACATRLAHRARRQGTPVRVRIVNPDDMLTERIRLHQAATGQRLPGHRIRDLLRPAGVELVMGSASRIDLERRQVDVGGATLGWDRLVLALGSRSGSESMPEGSVPVNPDSTPVLLHRLRSLKPGSRIVVVGGGLTGIESASEIAESFPQLRVHLSARNQFAQDFSPPGRAHILRTLERLNVQVQRQAERPVEAEACVWAAGFSLPGLPRDAGLQVNERGQVQVDPMLRSVSHPFVYAAGDIASPVFSQGQPVPMGCKSAMPMGVQVAENVAHELRGHAPEGFDYACTFHCVSLGRRDGLIQWADPTGAPEGRILTGRRAALFKEVICRSTVWALKLEAKGRKAVIWKRTGQAPCQPGSREQAAR